MGVTSIDTHPGYDATRLMLVSKFLRLGNAIKRDVSRIMSLSKEYSPQMGARIARSKERIFERLEHIAEIRNTTRIQEEGWNQILESTLAQVYKHSNTEEIRVLLQGLLMADKQDVSKTGIHFLQEYMKIVARIPESQIILPFKP